MAPNILKSFLSLNVGQAYRMTVTLVSTLAVLWVGSKPFVYAWAGDAFVNMLQQNGMDPADFAAMKKQTEQSSKDIKDLSDDTEKIKGDIGDVGKKIDEVVDQVGDTDKTVERLEKLMNDLIKIQLRQRADMSSSPPGTGPVGPPLLERVQ